MGHHTVKSGYRHLVERLNRFPQGAPPTKVLYQILALLFSEREAELVAQLPMRPFNAERAARNWQLDLDATRRILDELASRAILVDIEQDGETFYVLPPPMAGFFEFSLMRVRGDIDQKVLSELYYQYLNMDMSGPDPKDRIEVLAVLERASHAANADRWQEAAPLLEGISLKDPTNPLIYKILKECYERLGQIDRMEEVCNRALRNKIESDEILAELGEIYIRRRNLDRATGIMEDAAKLNPGNLQNMDNLATAYLQQGRVQECERVLRAVLAQNELHGMAHNLLGLLEVQRSRLGEARIHLEQAIQCSPEIPEPYMNLGLIAQNAGNKDAAVAMYREFLKRADKVKHSEYIPKVRAAIAELKR